jgi:hypothetical protein
MLMKPKIVFLVMSAVHPVSVVRELSRSLAPQTVLVHHDFTQTPDFLLDEPNVILVPDPKKTGWGVWGFIEAVFHAMRFAVKTLDFDYLQLLSPTCLPIKPMHAFEEHVASRRTEVDVSWIDVYDDQDALMSVGYRIFAPEHSLSHRILRRLSVEYFGDNPVLKDVAGVQLRTQPAAGPGGKLPLRARLALKVTKGYTKPEARRHIFDQNFRPYFGSAWFGAHRHVIEWMLRRFSQPDIARQFSRARIPEELVMVTMLKNAGFKAGPYNHCIITFMGPNPKWIDEQDYETLRRSPAFFARKLPVEAASPIRRRVLLELAQVDQRKLDGQSGVIPDRPRPDEQLREALDAKTKGLTAKELRGRVKARSRELEKQG